MRTRIERYEKKMLLLKIENAQTGRVDEIVVVLGGLV